MSFVMLDSVKDALGITSDFQDSTLKFYIKEVEEYLRAAGVDESIIGTELSSGTVARGVADLWNYGSGDGKLSLYFYERVIQLSVGK